MIYSDHVCQPYNILYFYFTHIRIISESYSKNPSQSQSSSRLEACVWSASTGTKSGRKERTRRGSDGESGRGFLSVPVEGLCSVIKKMFFDIIQVFSKICLFMCIYIYMYMIIYIYIIYICICLLIWSRHMVFVDMNQQKWSLEQLIHSYRDIGSILTFTREHSSTCGKPM